MKLFFAPLSPYARKVRILIAEKGLDDRIEFVELDPYESSERISAHNPLGKVPCLQLDDGQTLFDSRVIIEYLDSLSQPVLMPNGEMRWQALTRIALCEGILDAAYGIATQDNRRAAQERSEKVIERFRGVIERSLIALQSNPPPAVNARIVNTRASQASDIEVFDVEHIVTMVTLDYVEFRAGQYLDWRLICPQLLDFYARFVDRPSVRTSRLPQRSL